MGIKCISLLLNYQWHMSVGPSTRVVAAGVLCQLQLHCKFETSLGYIRPCLKNMNQWVNEWVNSNRKSTIIRCFLSIKEPGLSLCFLPFSKFHYVVYFSEFHFVVQGGCSSPHPILTSWRERSQLLPSKGINWKVLLSFSLEVKLQGRADEKCGFYFVSS